MKNDKEEAEVGAGVGWFSTAKPPEPATTTQRVYSDPEVCICAAIRLPDGRIFRGHRHADALLTAQNAVTWNGGKDTAEGRAWLEEAGG